MPNVLISKKAKKKIEAIFEHPDGIYSVYLKDQNDVVWVSSKEELYLYLHFLSK